MLRFRKKHKCEKYINEILRGDIGASDKLSKLEYLFNNDPHTRNITRKMCKNIANYLIYKYLNGVGDFEIISLIAAWGEDIYCIQDRDNTITFIYTDDPELLINSKDLNDFMDIYNTHIILHKVEPTESIPRLMCDTVQELDL